MLLPYRNNCLNYFAIRKTFPCHGMYLDCTVAETQRLLLENAYAAYTWSIKASPHLAIFLHRYSRYVFFNSVLQNYPGSLKIWVTPSEILVWLGCNVAWALDRNRPLFLNTTEEWNQTHLRFRWKDIRIFGKYTTEDYSVPIYPGSVGGVDEKYYGQINVSE